MSKYFSITTHAHTHTHIHTHLHTLPECTHFPSIYFKWTHFDYTSYIQYFHPPWPYLFHTDPLHTCDHLLGGDYPRVAGWLLDDDLVAKETSLWHGHHPGLAAHCASWQQTCHLVSGFLNDNSPKIMWMLNGPFGIKLVVVEGSTKSHFQLCL